MTYADTYKVDANAKADVPDASDASDASKIDTPNIDVKRGVGKPCAVAIVLSRRLYLRNKALCNANSAGEGSDTGKLDATIDAKKRYKTGKKRQ